MTGTDFAIGGLALAAAALAVIAVWNLLLARSRKHSIEVGVALLTDARNTLVTVTQQRDDARAELAALKRGAALADSRDTVPIPEAQEAAAPTEAETPVPVKRTRGKGKAKVQ